MSKGELESGRPRGQRHRCLVDPEGEGCRHSVAARVPVARSEVRQSCWRTSMSPSPWCATARAATVGYAPDVWKTWE